MSAKATLDLLDLINLEAADYKEAMADGKFTIFDAPKFFNSFPKLINFSGEAKHVPEELKNLSGEDVQIVLQAAFKTLLTVCDAVFSYTPAP